MTNNLSVGQWCRLRARAMMLVRKVPDEPASFVDWNPAEIVVTVAGFDHDYVVILSSRGSDILVFDVDLEPI